jgi:ActR/RegA family two-component response regulator
MDIQVDVALIVWNPDVIEMISCVLLARNLTARGMEPSEGTDRVERLIESSHPSVVVFDLAPPYDKSAEVVQHLASRFTDSGFVITCADPALATRAAPWVRRYPILQKPYAIEEIGRVIGSVAEAFPLRGCRRAAQCVAM